MRIFSDFLNFRKTQTMSDRNMLSLNCNSEHCNFRTPLQGREQYQAMVAHLQVLPSHQSNPALECINRCTPHWLMELPCRSTLVQDPIPTGQGEEATAMWQTMSMALKPVMLLPSG